MPFSLLLLFQSGGEFADLMKAPNLKSGDQDDWWAVAVTVPEAADKLQLAFTNGSDAWESNGGSNYALEVQQAAKSSTSSSSDPMARTQPSPAAAPPPPKAPGVEEVALRNKGKLFFVYPEQVGFGSSVPGDEWLGLHQATGSGGGDLLPSLPMLTPRHPNSYVQLVPGKPVQIFLNRSMSGALKDSPEIKMTYSWNDWKVRGAKRQCR